MARSSRQKKNLAKMALAEKGLFSSKILTTIDRKARENLPFVSGIQNRDFAPLRKLLSFIDSRTEEEKT